MSSSVRCFGALRSATRCRAGCSSSERVPKASSGSEGNFRTTTGVAATAVVARRWRGGLRSDSSPMQLPACVVRTHGPNVLAAAKSVQPLATKI